MPTLQRGSQGEAVITLQTVLQGVSFFRGEINGKFGLDTDAAVRAFQKRYGLVPDGIVGLYTWLALSKVPH
jgi:peptidoglycan hydrolase-like protein with peptidoglycan-binding domain